MKSGVSKTRSPGFPGIHFLKSKRKFWERDSHASLNANTLVICKFHNDLDINAGIVALQGQKKAFFCTEGQVNEKSNLTKFQTGICLFDLGLTSLSTIFQSYRDGVWM